MPRFLCATCGALHPDADQPPATCPICDDPRQWAPEGGARWTTPEALAAGHMNAFRQIAPGLIAIETQPAFAIGQRAILVRRPQGNVLWDCVALLDPATKTILDALGGLSAIALSHPHFQTAAGLWAEAFGCPVLAHEADRGDYLRDDPGFVFWGGARRDLAPGVAIHHVGGHFAGSCVLHLADDRRILTGDTVMVTPDRAHVAFMRSYPNLVPLPGPEAERVAARLLELDFETIHSAFRGRGDLTADGRGAVRRSLARHLGGAGA
ncbi:MAG: MBL fold metallo-hydrolase [Pseudomonadota bacterium]|nr:MBL fold metallo-hydrolase [Pseudomonadota bacterium]MEE3099623.1 MBL fold metallo-hydrolase [Pseudomonadota bacterium]